MTPTSQPPSHPPSQNASARQATHHEDDHLYDDEFVHNEDVAHEHSDVNVRQLLMYTAGLVITCLVCAAIVWGLFLVFERQAAANDPQLSPLAVPAGQSPPAPRLVTNEPSVLRKHRQMEAAILEQYGWVDQPGGVARLPIAEAKKRLLHDGLAVRADAPSDPWIGTHAAARGESSSGRAIPLKRSAPAAQAPAPEHQQPPAKAPAAPHKGGH